MERDVNIKLIYIILILLLALGGTAILYQLRYDNMRDSYEQSFREYNKTFANISSNQKSFYSNISDINVSYERENVLVSKLETKTKELETVSRELANVQQQLFENEGKFDAMNLNSSYANEILNRHTISIGKMQAKIDNLNTHIETYVENKASKDVLLKDISEIQTELDKLKSR
jgi:chromosome segregation ATPase